MKTLAILIVGISLVTITTPVNAGNIDEDIDLVKSKYCNLFVFKAGKDYLGSTVEVFHSDGEIVSSEILDKRKMIIDFCDVKVGTYTVRITKGNEVKEFRHQRLPR